MELAGEGALLKMTEERKRRLAAEGLFDPARKKRIPFLPDVIGVVTSGALSPTIGVPIAMAYVAPRFARPGTELQVDVRGTRLPFTVTALPFYSRKKN